MYGLKTESSFDAAHFLTDYHGKCENLHGHRWRVVAYLEQEDLQSEGTMKDMVLDFGEFKQAVAQTVVDALRPIQQEYARLLADRGYLDGVLAEGAVRAGAIARHTLAKVYKKIGFLQL